ncbi:hypothetical protein ACFWUU_28605 [Kribbella sp. NPDC058693]|uniref:hypothetical protein n=1 Tax=Kribbella sp. NPDC058693 TaxID=3346602 RepID=UPI00364EF224
MKTLNLIALASLFTSLVMFVSVLRLHGHAWKQAGKRKWLWALLPVVAYLVLLSIPLALWYYIRIRPPVARADADCIAARMANRRTRAANRPQVGGLQAQQSTSASNWMTAGPTKQPCSACSNGKQMCWSCNGRGSYQDYDGSYKNCGQCSGGYTPCSSCGGSGYR